MSQLSNGQKWFSGYDGSLNKIELYLKFVEKVIRVARGMSTTNYYILYNTLYFQMLKQTC